jgi:hypothetical protein
VASAQLPHGHEWANCAPFKCPAPSPRSLPADPTEPSSGRWTAWASGFLLTQPSNGYIQLPKRTMLRVPAGKKSLNTGDEPVARKRGSKQRELKMTWEVGRLQSKLVPWACRETARLGTREIWLQ